MLTIATVLLLALPRLSTTPYAAPEGPKAAITLINATDHPVAVAFYKEAAECRDREILKPMLKGGQSRTTAIPTTGEVSLTLSQDTGLGWKPGGLAIVGCNMTFTMQAEAGAAYAVKFRNIDKVCQLEITKTADANGPLAEPQPAEHRVRIWRRPMGEAGPFCRP
jgi:hypothetical protein